MDLPRYFIVGARPVKFVETPGGGMDVLAWDWNSKQFAREMRYLSRCVEGDAEVDEVDEAQFERRVAELRAAPSAGDGGRG